ncbi:MAG: hypothetical protein H6707_13520 [Deltaproteobacteria bacterium]|nr:hypothetical protein [Deltaproteobacteria bacterium]
MNPADLQVEIRPRSAGQILAIVARMLQRRPGSMLSVWLLCALPLLSIALGLLLWARWNPWWVWLVVLLIGPVFMPAAISTCGMLVFLPRVRLVDALVNTLRRTPQFLALFFVGRLLALVGLVALVVPGLYLWRNQWFVGPIVMLERSGLAASMRRARRFAGGFHDRVFGHAAGVAAVLAYTTLALATINHSLIAYVFGSSIEVVGALTEYYHYRHLLSLIGFCLALPLATFCWFFVYLDVRIRKEGWDLEIAFRRLAEARSRSLALGDGSHR